MHPQSGEIAGLDQAAAASAHTLIDAHGSLGASAELRSAVAGLRSVVRDSWLRSLQLLGSPANARARDLDQFEPLAAARERSPLQRVLPVLDRLLVEPARDTGLIVAITNEQGRLLWVRGDSATLRRAERMDFVEGADWSEAAVGTSAPGTALASGRGVQIAGAEHFAPAVQLLSCTAVPIHDPFSGIAVGAIDLTGDERAVGPHSLALMRAAVAAAEAEMRLAVLLSHHSSQLGVHPGAPAKADTVATGRISTLGVHRARLTTVDGAPFELSGRHAEILTLLAARPSGLTSGELALRVYGESAKEVTLRAEIARLRPMLAERGLDLVPRPYRVAQGIASDAVDVLDLLEAGDVAAAVESYRGELLPASEAPGIRELRAEISATLRDQVLSSAEPATLLRYLELPEVAQDAQAFRTALRVLPPHAPARSRLVAKVEALES
ncbi:MULTISPECIES: helix-turn-helix domain-containing protein [unclassified Pseudoclavibacter]|uniref:helix-turn-helix domain-containing protein n=1 Tax=unclassified Pseudoclavibacter TaxID=2615177 RepID=UPI0012F3055F|nr:MULTISPECIES: helix-turn-helix domain-containing protein [unclassified Pseudoclavibacter]MBF4460577.1 GAF domain-containing protein [Pseudoclavibacter sp. VKM Ac-2867]VXB21491.1 Transcriptional regulator [Pseudoclavibacter sp. 8L]